MAEVSEWGIAEYEDWLRVGLEAIVIEGSGPAALFEASSQIMRTNSLPQGLRLFSETLSVTQRQSLKDALANVLTNLEPREGYVALVQELLSIAIAISAQTILRVLPGKIGRGFFGLQAGNDSNDLFLSALYAVARFSSSGNNEARKCLECLIESANFRPAHAATALIALCEIDPTQLLDHLDFPNLRPNLLVQIDEFNPDTKLQERLALDLLDVVGISTIVRSCNDIAWPNLVHREFGNIRSNFDGDEWLIEFMLFAPLAPLQIERSGSKVFIYETQRPTSRIELKSSDPIVRKPKGIVGASERQQHSIATTLSDATVSQLKRNGSIWFERQKSIYQLDSGR